MNAVKVYGITVSDMKEGRWMLAHGFNHDSVMNTLRQAYERNKAVVNAPLSDTPFWQNQRQREVQGLALSQAINRAI